MKFQKLSHLMVVADLKEERERKMGRMTGIEPATTGITILGSTN